MSKDELLSTLYNRHAAALSVVAQDGNQRVHIDAARMALALMARELADKLYSAQPAVNAEDASINAVIVRQVERLLEEYACDLHDRLLSGEFTTVDQALAVLLDRKEQTLKSVIDLRDEEAVRRHNAEHRIVELDAENARLRQIEATLRAELADANRRAAVITGNGKTSPAAVLVQAFDADQPSTDYTGLDWSSLSQAAQDYLIGLDAGRWKWRDIPKSTRLELVRCVIRNAGHMPTQAQFDAVRPSWMATADAQKAAFAVQWGILANLDREIEVTP